MTEHKKIPIPGQNGPGSGPAKGGSDSLLERASGAFGLDSFGAAPVPRGLADAPMKPARKVKRAAQSGTEQTNQAAPAADAHAAHGFHGPDGAQAQPHPHPQAQPHPQPQADQTVHSAHTDPHADAQTASADSHAHANLPVPVAPSEVMLAQGYEPLIFRGQKYAIDRKKLTENGLISPEGAISGLVEEFRIIKRAVMSAANMHGTAASRRVLICSPLPGEGKSFCASNLAIALSGDHETEVLLVDADIAKPTVLKNFGLPTGPGLMDVLADPGIRIEETVMGTDIPGLWILPAGSPMRTDSEYLASSRTAEVLDRLTLGAPNRIVIFDSPPALAASPAAELAKHVGQTLLIARADSTGQTALEDAYQLLSACPDVKLLLNAAHFSPSGRRFGSYYGYEE